MWPFKLKKKESILEALARVAGSFLPGGQTPRQAVQETFRQAPPPSIRQRAAQATPFPAAGAAFRLGRDVFNTDLAKSGRAGLRSGVYEPLVNLGADIQRYNPLVRDKSVIDRDRKGAIEVGRRVAPDPTTKIGKVAKGAVELGTIAAPGAIATKTIRTAPRVAGAIRGGSKLASAGSFVAGGAPSSVAYTLQQSAKRDKPASGGELAKELGIGAGIDLATLGVGRLARPLIKGLTKGRGVRPGKTGELISKQSVPEAPVRVSSPEPVKVRPPETPRAASGALDSTDQAILREISTMDLNRAPKVRPSDNWLSWGQATGGRRARQGISAPERAVARSQQDFLKTVQRSNKNKNTVAQIAKGLNKTERLQVGQLVDNPNIDLSRPVRGVSDKVLNAARRFREWDDAIIREVNSVRAAQGRQPVPYRPGHMFHQVRGRQPVFTEGGFTPSEIRAGASKPRTGAPDFEPDPFKSAAAYTDMMMKDAHLTPALARMKAIRDIMAKRGQVGQAEWLTRQIEGNILGRPTTQGVMSDAALRLQPGSTQRRAVSGVQQARANAALLANPRFLTTQTLSTMNTLAEGGPRAFVKGHLAYFFNPATRARVKQYPMYKLKQETGIARSAAGDIDTATKLKQGKVKAWMGAASRTVEKHMNGLALATGEFKAKQLGLKGKEARIFTDGMAQMTQSMYDAFNRTQRLNSLGIRAAFPFQTYSFEAFRAAKRYIAPGLGGGRPEAGATRLNQVASLMAGLYAVNEFTKFMYGQSKTTAGTFVPLAGGVVDNAIEEGVLRFKASQGDKEAVADLERRNELSGIERYALRPEGRFAVAPIEDGAKIVQASLQFIQSDDKSSRLAWNDLRKQATFWIGGALGLPGGQANRMVDGLIAANQGFTETKTGKVSAPLSSIPDKVRALAFGPHTTGQAIRVREEGLPALSDEQTEQFRKLSNPADRQAFFEKESRARKAYFKDKRETDRIAEGLPEAAKRAYDNWYGKQEEKSAERQITRYQGLLAEPEALALVMESERRKKDRGDDVSPLFDPNQLQDQQRLNVLRWRASKALRNAGQAEGKDGESLFVALGLDEKWYDDFSKAESKFYDNLKAKGVETGDEQTFSGATRPQASPELQAKLDHYFSLPKRSGDRRAFLQANPDILEHWAERDNFTNAERVALGMKPLGERGGGRSFAGGSRGGGGGRGRRSFGTVSIAQPRNIPTPTISVPRRTVKVKPQAKKSGRIKLG